MGLTDATYPNQELFSQGFVGVAKLSSGCIVTFSTLGVHHKGSLSAAILSRFSPTGLTVAQVDSTLAQLTAFVAAYRQVCTLTSSTSSGTAV
jgi:hypothetical protein